MTRACLAGERCRERDRSTNRPAESTEPLCTACIRVAARSVGLLVYDYRDLDALIPRPVSRWVSDRPGSSSTARPAPIREDVDELQREIVWVAGLWHEVLADRLQLAPPPTGRRRPGHVVQRAVEVIRPRVRTLASVGPVEVLDYPHRPEVATVTGAEALLHLDQLHQRARSTLGLTRTVTRLPGECSGCLRADLRQDEPTYAGQPVTVYCGSCARTWTREDYETYVGLILGRPT